jgi:hypothetical protein
MTTVTNLEALLAKGPDSALLRYSLGNEYLKLGDLEKAIDHLAMRRPDSTPVIPPPGSSTARPSKPAAAPRRRLPSWIRASPLPRRGVTSRPPRRWASFASGP